MVRRDFKGQKGTLKDEAVLKLVFLALQNASKKWTDAYHRMEVVSQPICYPLLAIYTANMTASKKHMKVHLDFSSSAKPMYSRITVYFLFAESANYSLNKSLKTSEKS